MGVHTYLLFFAPIFILMIGAEFYVGRRRGLTLYTRGETLASLIIALVQRVLALLPLSLVPVAAAMVWDVRFFQIPEDSWWYIPALFLGVEFFYYWFHRLSHEIRWLWATHSVHHSIEEMNVMAAYRFGWTGWLSLGGMVYLPLYLIGFQPVHVVITLAINLMYQSWLHTTLIGKLGWLEGVVNTPSAHRVHHAKNADYLDRNHGGVLMIFDRIFGTYVEERDEDAVQYGLINPSRSYNPVRIAFHEWVNIFKDLKTYSLKYWPGLLFGPPGWKPGGQGRTSADLRREFKQSRQENSS